MRTILSIIFSATVASAAILPTDRTIDWTGAGVVGGIPSRTTENTITGLVNDGVTDNRATIQAAINACAVGEVVKIPAGSYAVSGSLSLKSGITLRGAGPTSTTLVMNGTSGQWSGFIAMGSVTPPYAISTYGIAISSGATKGSTSIVVASADGITANTTHLIITDLGASYIATPGKANEGSPADVTFWNDSNAHMRGQTVRVTNVSGTTLTISPALYCAYDNTPLAVPFNPDCANAGVEDIGTYATNSGHIGATFAMIGAYNCWVKNCKNDFTDSYHVHGLASLHCEVRRCDFRDAFVHTPGNADNAVMFQMKASENLVIDNILMRMTTSVVMNRGASGNVVAYNYASETIRGDAPTHMMPSFCGNHGAHPQFNLFEGNAGDQFWSDSYWGSASHTTLLRNWFRGYGSCRSPFEGRGTLGAATTYTTNVAAVNLFEGQTRFSFIGNILGDGTTTSPTYTFEDTYPDERNAYSGGKYIWLIGYAADNDNNDVPILAATADTLLDHGNWDGVNAAQTWEGDISDHDVPTSYVYSEKPSFFRALAWPAFNPASPGTPSVAQIPAGYRYLYGEDPPAESGTNPVINVQPVNGVCYRGSTTALVVTATSGTSMTYQWKKGAGNVSGATAATLTLSNAQPADAGSYTVDCTNATGTTTSSAATLTVVTSAAPAGMTFLPSLLQ